MHLVSISAFRRPEPPATMEKEAAEEWRRVVASMPEDWFGVETLALLEDRCNQVVWLRRTTKAVNAILKKRDCPVSEYHTLMKLAMRQSVQVAMLDSKMRLTQQSTYDRTQTKRRAGNGPAKPWQTG